MRLRHNICPLNALLVGTARRRSRLPSTASRCLWLESAAGSGDRADRGPAAGNKRAASAVTITRWPWRAGMSRGARSRPHGRSCSGGRRGRSAPSRARPRARSWRSKRVTSTASSRPGHSARSPTRTRRSQRCAVCSGREDVTRPIRRGKPRTLSTRRSTAQRGKRENQQGTDSW